MNFVNLWQFSRQLNPDADPGRHLWQQNYGLRGRTKLSRLIFKVLIPNIGVLGAYIALFRPKMSDIGILHFF
jgi:hypothetical protein